MYIRNDFYVYAQTQMYILCLSLLDLKWGDKVLPIEAYTLEIQALRVPSYLIYLSLIAAVGDLLLN